MKRGYIKLWRKSKESHIFSHEGMWKLWCLCLMNANSEEAKVTIPGLLEPVTVKAGQFITGRDSLHYDYHQGDILGERYSRKRRPVAKTLFRWLLILEKMQILSIKSYNKYSIITVFKWHLYQKNVQQMSREMSNKCPQTRSTIYSCEFFSVTHSQHEKYQEAYPTVDLMAEYKGMAAWLESNPKKRKTPRGYPKFVNAWLSKAYKEKKHSSDWRDKLKPL